MLAVTESLGEVAFEFTAVVGLPDQIAERDAVAIQMLLNAGSEDGAGRRRTFLRESPEEQSAANIASGVLNDGQAEPLGLRPVAGNIIEIMGVGADLLKQGPLSFDVGQVLLALIFLFSLFQQTLLVPDPFQGAVADGQIEFANEAAGAKGGVRLAQLNQRGFQRGWSFQRLAMRGPGTFL